MCAATNRAIWACLAFVGAGAIGVVAQKTSIGEAKVKNPYYSDRKSPPWKLWYADESPVTYSRKDSDGKAITRTLQLPPAAKRETDMWDDAVASLDGNHVRLRQDYLLGNRRIPFAGQMIQILHGSPRFEDRLRLGINFAWQSYARKGHHLFVDERIIRRMEETFTFANCLYASPGWLSRTDVMPDRMVDSYDGLFGHYYNSLGQFGSEAHAVAKMMYAGSQLPRETKNVLKRHGVYPLVMLTIFKASLPYRLGNGKEVPYANELRHRPSYASNGRSVSTRYVSRELEYHLYDEAVHVRRMVAMARAVTNPPPITLLQPLKIKGSIGGTNVLKSSSFTSLRIHGARGERIEATVDLGRSYDLAGRPLTFHAQRVYPEQKNIEVSVDERGVAKVVATHDESYPRGRFPVILWVENGTDCPGNPVFVNFHWPANEQPDRPAYFAPYRKPFMTEQDIRKFTGRGAVRDPNVQVMRNDKPSIKIDDTELQAAVGRELSLSLPTKDPEGSPTRFYLWSRDVGRIEEGQFRLTPTKKDRGRTFVVRMICSDGKGAYRGRTLKISVE